MIGHREGQAAHRHVGIAHCLDLDAELRAVCRSAEQPVQQGDDSAGGMSADIAVKPTRSAKATVTRQSIGDAHSPLATIGTCASTLSQPAFGSGLDDDVLLRSSSTTALKQSQRPARGRTRP
jgi:hypothetical protein